jgi:hypothetical protein
LLLISLFFLIFFESFHQKVKESKEKKNSLHHFLTICTFFYIRFFDKVKKVPGSGLPAKQAENFVPTSNPDGVHFFAPICLSACFEAG